MKHMQDLWLGIHAIYGYFLTCQFQTNYISYRYKRVGMHFRGYKFFFLLRGSYILGTLLCVLFHLFIETTSISFATSLKLSLRKAKTSFKSHANGKTLRFSVAKLFKGNSNQATLMVPK